MKTSELRLGNFVHESYGGTYQVLALTPDYVDLVKPLMSVPGRYDISSIEPLMLTEEWLLQFGFERLNSTAFKKTHPNEMFDYIIYTGGKYCICIDSSQEGEEYSAFSWDIEYVHQLQNLYFALTAEELTVEIDKYK